MGCAGGTVQERPATVPAPRVDEPSRRAADRPALARPDRFRARPGHNGRLEGVPHRSDRILGNVSGHSPSIVLSSRDAVQLVLTHTVICAQVVPGERCLP